MQQSSNRGRTVTEVASEAGPCLPESLFTPGVAFCEIILLLGEKGEIGETVCFGLTGCLLLWKITPVTSLYVLQLQVSYTP